MYLRHVLAILVVFSLACADRESPEVEQQGGGAVEQNDAPNITWSPRNWAPRTSEEENEDQRPMSTADEFDFGEGCNIPEGCSSDSADWPDCLDAQCNTGDCSRAVFADYGYCARACTDDSQCVNAVSNGPYGENFRCLTDGVSGVCAPGSNDRCDYGRDGRCDDPNEACKFSLIWAPDAVYGGVCQPKTIDGRKVGESCDEEAGVFCENDMCVFGTCISLCDPNAEESICPEGYGCFEEWYPFGTDSTIHIDACLPMYCETNSDCAEGFGCELAYAFNSSTTLRGICLRQEEGQVTSGGECCVTDECTAQNPEVGCLGASCFDDSDGVGYCSGLCNNDDDCPGSDYCTIVTFGISAEPGSAPVQLCQEGTGSGRPCSTNADCAAEGEFPAEACDYVIRGELEAGRFVDRVDPETGETVSGLTVGGRCTSIPLNAVGYGESCGNLAGSCTNDSLCLSTGGGNGFCSQPCRNRDDCDEESLCYGLGLSGDIEGGACVPGRLLGMTGASLTRCRRDADCEAENEHCGLNIISSRPGVVEGLCMTNQGEGSVGAVCNTGMDCASGTCLPRSTDATQSGYCLGTCRSDADCGEAGFACERQVVDLPSGAEGKVCIPDEDCLPCSFDGSQACAGDRACSTVDYSSGPAATCLTPCLGIGDANCPGGFSCAPHIGESGTATPDQFVCTPNDPEESCGAAQPR